MPAETAALALTGLVLAATLLGVGHRATRGRARRVVDSRVVRIDGVALGSRATLLQFSSEVCAPCRSTARVLDEVARSRNVAHVDLDVSRRPELAARFRILQTPTTLILDGDGVVRARIGGALRRETVAARLQEVLVG